MVGIVFGGEVGMKRVTVSDVRRSYTSEKARMDLISHLWLYLVLRPLSFYITPLFINLGFSANAVTALGLLPLIGGLVFILLGAANPFNFIIGAVLMNIWLLFDCIDGNVARTQGQSSTFGELFDFMMELVRAFLPLCLGIGLYLGSPEPLVLALWVEPPSWFWLLAGVVHFSAGLFRKVVSMQFRIVTGEHGFQPKGSKISVWDVLPRAIFSFELPLLMIASLVGCLGFFLIGSATYSLVTFLGMVTLVLRRALLLDRQLHCDYNDK